MPIITTQELKAWQKELRELQDQYALSRSIGTKEGFFKRYFNLLPKSRTQVEAFNAVNFEYFEIFGEYRYESYDSFRKQCSKYQKSK